MTVDLDAQTSSWMVILEARQLTFEVSYFFLEAASAHIKVPMQSTASLIRHSLRFPFVTGVHLHLMPFTVDANLPSPSISATRDEPMGLTSE